MFGNLSLATRIAVGKTVGLGFGLAGFLMLPYFVPDADPLLRWGFLLWYLSLGALIGMAGVLDRHPALDMRFPWWLRSPLIGAWMNFVLTLLIHDRLTEFSRAMFGEGSTFSSPFWFVAEGALVGLVIGYAATRAGGEGPETAGR